MSSIQGLPNEIWLHILSFITLSERQAKLSCVSTLFKSLVDDKCFDRERTIARIYLQYPQNIIDAVGGIQKFLALDTSEMIKPVTKDFSTPTRGAIKPFLAFTTISNSNQVIIKKHICLIPSKKNAKEWTIFSRRELPIRNASFNAKFCNYMHRLFAGEPCGIYVLKTSQETPCKLPDGKTVTYLVKGCS